MKLDNWLYEVDIHELKSAVVYAIVDEDNEVLYIGQTDCLARRIGEHCDVSRRKNKEGSTSLIPFKDIFHFKVLAYEDSEEERKLLEEEFTHEYGPKYYRTSAKSFAQVDGKLDRYKLRKLNKEHPNRPEIPRDYNESFDNPDEELQYLMDHRHQPD